MKQLLHRILMACLLLTVVSANALDVLDYLTDKDGKYIGPSVEDNVVKMDTDNNGFADVSEIRAFLARKHGADYQKKLLDRWEVLANSKSCGTTFVEEFTKELSLE